MPKSKRQKLVSLTKTKQARKELKGKLVEDVRSAAEKYDAAFVFGFENLRTERFKDLRLELSDSRFFLGKNKVMQLALGTDEDSAHRPGLHQVAADLTGNVGLLFTSRPTAEVVSFFSSFGEPDFARAGFVPSETIKQPAGRLTTLPHTMHDELRKLGMPVRLDKGVLVLPQDYTLCHAGKPLTPEQGRLLKHFGHQLAVFRITPLSVVRDGKYTPLVTSEALLAHNKYAGAAADDKDSESDDDAAAADGADEEAEGGAAAPAPAKGKAAGGKAKAAAKGAKAAAAPAATAAAGAGSAASTASKAAKKGSGKKKAAAAAMDEDE